METGNKASRVYKAAVYVICYFQLVKGLKVLASGLKSLHECTNDPMLNAATVFY